MTPSIPDFFENRGEPYYINNIIKNWSDLQWENRHNFIQWCFPTTKNSAFSPNAPTLDINTAQWLNSNHSHTMEALTHRFISFLTYEKLSTVNHNMLRISRAIQCLQELNMPQLANKVYFQAIMNTTVPGEHFHYWAEAHINTESLIAV